MTAYRSNAGTLVAIEKVHIKPGWQGPQFFDEEKAKRIAYLMQQEIEFPPIQIQETEDGYFVIDGLHRLAASKRCSFTHIPIVPWI